MFFVLINIILNDATIFLKFVKEDNMYFQLR